MTYDFSLQGITFIVAGVVAGLSIAAMANPAGTGQALASFPRSRTMATVLTAIALLWTAWLLMNMPMGGLNAYKKSLYVLAPLSFFLITRYLDELLSSRALGGLLALVPATILDAARWHDSPARYVVILLAYVLAIIGMWLILCPWRFRVWMQPLVDSTKTCRKAALSSLIAASGMALLAFFAY